MERGVTIMHIMQIMTYSEQTNGSMPVKLTLAGVNAYHTNGLTEKRVKDLQDLTRTGLIFVATKWQGCIIANI